MTTEVKHKKSEHEKAIRTKESEVNRRRKKRGQSGEAVLDVFDGGTENPEMQKRRKPEKWSLKCLMDEILILSELLPMQSTEVTAAIYNTLLGEKR